MVKNPPAMWETWIWSLDWEDPLEKEMATHSSILAQRIPWTEEPGGLQSMGSQRVRHDWVTSLTLCAKSLQSCLTFCDPMDCSPPGSSVHGILQARILEWVAIPFSPGDLSKPGIKPGSPALQADSLPFELQESPNSFLLNIFFPQSSLLFTDFKRVSIL